MSENNTELEDIIEDVTEEQLIANEELVQDLPEVSEEQEVPSFSESIKSVLLGEKKAVKEDDEEEEEEEEEEEDEEEMDESTETDLDEAKAKTESEEEGEEEEEVEEKCDEKKKNVKEALDLLISNDSTLSEDFKSEASTLFEAAIAEKSVQIQENLEAKYNKELNEEVETLRESLIERMDSYLSYVVESWIEENSEQVETTLRAEIAENFMVSLKDLFVENYIEVPAEKRDIVEELASTSEDRLSQIVEKETEIEELSAKIESFERKDVLDELAEDLSVSEQHRLNTILEGVEFENRETFTKKVQTIKESIFEVAETVTESTEAFEAEGETEIIIEGNDTESKISASMQQYLKALSK